MSELIEIEEYYQGTTNVREFGAIYSTKRRKFIKGFRQGDRVSGRIFYRLYPGLYVKFWYYYWGGQDPPTRISVTLFEVTKEGKVKPIKDIRIHFYSAEFLKQFPEQIRDFYNARPRYHMPPALNCEKVYSEEEHNSLLKLLEKGGVFEEGGEHE